jgi:uncharacterized integral membrane protein
VSDAPSPPPGDPPDKKSEGIPWRLVGIVALALYAVIFVLVNDEKQELNFVFFTVNTRLLWLILLSMALGAGLALVGPRWWRSRRRDR